MDNKNLFRIPKNFSFKNLKKDQLLILFLAGVLLLVIALPVGKEEEKQENTESNMQIRTENILADSDDYISYQERHLEQILSQMDGVGEVTVMITLKSSSEKVVEKDVEENSETVTESDSQGGARTTQNRSRGETTVYDGGTENQNPYISKEISPQVEGVVVVAQGGENSVVKQNITEAVQALFGIDTHKIRIMKKN